MGDFASGNAGARSRCKSWKRDAVAPRCSVSHCYLIEDASNISGAGIFIDPAYHENIAGSVTIAIFSAYNEGAPSGLIGSGTSAANVTSTSGWIDVFFTPAAVTAGIQYYLMVESTNRLVASYSDRTNNYASGNAVLVGYDYPAYDLVFRTYSDNSVAQVPEPGTFALLGLGIVGLGLMRRKQRGQ